MIQFKVATDLMNRWLILKLVEGTLVWQLVDNVKWKYNFFTFKAEWITGLPLYCFHNVEATDLELEVVG